MFEDIYSLIEQFDKIVIARHVGPDPDAIASTMALRDSILLTFPDKEVLCIGNAGSRFAYFGELDKKEISNETDDLKDALLIVLDTPNTERIDGINILKFKKIIKIDHHPFIEKFGSIEYIDDKSSSASEMVLDLIANTNLKIDKNIASKLYLGIVSDTERFMFANSNTLEKVAWLMKNFGLDKERLDEYLFSRPLNEVKLESYIGLNLNLTENGVAYIKLTKGALDSLGVDASVPGKIINNFNYIKEVLVWVFFTEDIKNEMIKVSVRSRGPSINKILEKYNGGGHELASGARIKTMKEAYNIIFDLDMTCKEFRNRIVSSNDIQKVKK